MQFKAVLLFLLSLTLILSGCVNRSGFVTYSEPEQNQQVMKESQIPYEPEQVTPELREIIRYQCVDGSFVDDVSDCPVVGKGNDATVPEEVCKPDWECGKWLECTLAGEQTRVCVDKNDCGVSVGKPIESQQCTPSCRIVDTEEYHCQGDWLARGRQNSDCSVDFFLYEPCEYGCSEGKCNPKPETVAERCSELEIDVFNRMSPTELVHEIVVFVTEAKRQRNVHFFGGGIPGGESTGYSYEFDFVAGKNYYYVKTSDYEKDGSIDSILFYYAKGTSDLTWDETDSFSRMIQFVPGRSPDIIESRYFTDYDADGSLQTFQSFNCYNITNCVYGSGPINELRIDKRSDIITSVALNEDFRKLLLAVAKYIIGCGGRIGSIEFEYDVVDSVPEEQVLTVSDVVDGDTIKLSDGKTVRLIGINTPEVGEPCYSEAKDKLSGLVLGKEVMLEEDVGDMDRSGRLLRYIYVGDTFVNLALVELGLAHSYEYGLNTKYSEQLKQAEAKAKGAGGCLWKQSHENYIQDQCISIANFNFNALGDDNYNLNDEYVVFVNKCPYSIGMAGWTVRDESSSNRYTFPVFVSQPRTMFTLFTGAGANTASALYWGRTSGNYAAVWNNGGDTLYLRDSNGNLVLSQDYPGYA